MRNKYVHPEAHGPEVLEARIAPATLVASAVWKTGEAGEVFELHAGEGLSTAGDKAGAYLLYIEKGSALVFTTDFNNNGTLDENEITGIAAGDGLRMTLFTDVHGDIVTNLRERVIGGNTVLTLSDSDNNGINDPVQLKGDGRVLLNNAIEKIELRTLTVDDLPDQNADGLVDDRDVKLRVAPTSFSIFGNIYAGRGFGVATDPTSGLIIDSSGAANYDVLLGAAEVHPTIGSIKVGTAASGEWFSFGVSRNDDVAGTLQRFTPLPGQKGADIAYVRAADANTLFNLNSLKAGDGGAGGAGGDIVGVTLNADDSGGYEIIAGNGGRGATGGAGGSILQFTDLGSHTGKVVFKSGSGGTGTTGAGGNAGDFTFETMNIYGFVNIELGDGGTGFTSGGAGASLLTGTFTQNITPYNAGAGYGTSHMPDTSTGTYQPLIGNQQAIDFNGDGYGDFVYTTIGTSQLVVVLGGDATPNNTTDNLHAFDSERIYLSGVRNAEAMTVADLNGDGHPDIAVGSIDASNRSGIVVFLSKFEDLNNDGILDSSEDLNHNGVNDFLGFYEGRFSTLPQLNGFDTDALVSKDPYTKNEPQPYKVQDTLYKATSIPIGDIAAGDFDGDGRPELAVTANYNGTEVLLFLTADIEDDDLSGKPVYTGQFYADYGAKRIETPGGTTPPDPRKPYITLFDGLPGHAMIEATALSDSADHDVILVGTRDLSKDGQGASALYSASIATIEYTTRASVEQGGKFVAQSPQPIGFFSLGVVDRNRGAEIDLEGAFPLDFTVVDYDEDGFTDVIAITGDTAGFGYMVGSKGDGTGIGLDVSHDLTTGSYNNAGFFFGAFYIPHDSAVIRAIDGDADGTVDDVVVLGTYPGGGGDVLEFIEGTAQASNFLYTFSGPSLSPEGPHLADVWYPTAANLAEPVVAYAQGTSNIRFESLVAGVARNGYSIPNSEPGYKIVAGDGGNSIVGNGGVGGGIGFGSKLMSFTTIDPVTGLEVSASDLQGSVQFNIDGKISLVAGKGGDGFAKGGKGGGIVGVVSRGESDVSAIAGDGGRGVSAAGGEGGSIAAISLNGGYNIHAGNGGTGYIGGKGGSVIGNGTNLGSGKIIVDVTIPGGDNLTKSLTVLAGRGGDGTRGGGVGGSILNFRSELDASFVRMEAGDGGNSVGGTGGLGGSITGSSPTIGSIISSDIALIAGNGGSGYRGGAGGSVTSFLFKPASTNDNVRPTLLSVVAGHGGSGIAGSGGRGGDVSNIDVPTKGSVNEPTLEPYNYNRILAGNGGASAGDNGGTGGNITNVKTTAGQAAYAVVAGAGGSGLRIGGKGGNVLDTTVEIGSSTRGKVLVAAGAGGDASALIPNVNDPLSMVEQAQKAFGGRAGHGGDGGSITNFNQLGNIFAHVDLVAGDGGSSLHYGTVFDKTPVVGRGGDITHIRLAGDAGNIDPTVAIKSYNNILGGESMASWVEDTIRNNTEATKAKPATLSDSTGNVGVVVGASGRIKSVFDPNSGDFKSQPATFPKRDGNGDLVDFTAGNLLSAVAGSVDRIAVIHAARGITVTKGTLGADKAVVGQFEYYDANGTLTPVPVRDGRLGDGALIASSVTDLAGRPTTLVGRVYLL